MKRQGPTDALRQTGGTVSTLTAPSLTRSACAAAVCEDTGLRRPPSQQRRSHPAPAPVLSGGCFTSPSAHHCGKFVSGRGVCGLRRLHQPLAVFEAEQECRKPNNRRPRPGHWLRAIMRQRKGCVKRHATCPDDFVRRHVGSFERISLPDQYAWAGTYHAWSIHGVTCRAIANRTQTTPET